VSSPKFFTTEGFLLIKTDEALQLQKTLKDTIAPRGSALLSFGKIMEDHGYLEALRGFVLPKKFDLMSLFESEKSWVHQILDNNDRIGKLFEVRVTFSEWGDENAFIAHFLL
jgi:hypothetical protein